MKEYIRKETGSLIQQVIWIRLNMTAQKRNYWNKYGENLNCPLCDVKEDTTEHVLSCSKLPPHQLTQDDLYNIEDIGLWRKIIELIIAMTGCAVQLPMRNKHKSMSRTQTCEKLGLIKYHRESC